MRRSSSKQWSLRAGATSARAAIVLVVGGCTLDFDAALIDGSSTDGGTDVQGGSAGSAATGGASGEGGSTTHGGSSGAAGAEGSGGTPVDSFRVLEVTPVDGTSDADPTTNVVLEFSRPIDPTSVTSSSVTLNDGSMSLGGKPSIDGSLITLRPSGTGGEGSAQLPPRLDLITRYTVEATTDVADLDGNGLRNDFVSQFTVRDGIWQTESIVNDEDNTGTIDWSGYAFAVDPGGRTFVVWSQAADEGAETPTDILLRTYLPGAAPSEPMPIDDTSQGCSTPAVAINDAGDLTVLWIQGASGQTEIWSRHRRDGEWNQPRRVDTQDGVSYDTVTVAMSPSGRTLALYTYYQANTYYMRGNYASTGRNWGADQPVASSSDPLSLPALVMDSNGDGHVAWTDVGPGTRQVHYAWFDALMKNWGHDFDDTVPGSNGVVAPNSGRRLALAVDEDGRRMLVWHTTEDVVSVHFEPSSGWSDPVILSTAAGNAFDPTIVRNGSDFVAIWKQVINFTGNVYVARFEDGVWQDTEHIGTGNNVAPELGGGDPEIGVDRRGNLIALWARKVADEQNEIVFARSTNSTKTWSSPERINVFDDWYLEPHLAVAANGLAVATWHTGVPVSLVYDLWISTFE